jgi:single-stranded-DNA-specific exonuclease
MLRQGGIHPVLARLYAARGLTDPQELSSELAAMTPPGALLHIDAAAGFLADAIARSARMVIVADYDCDGATACAVALRGLRSMGANIDFIVPNRFEYGYGLTPEIVALTAAKSSRTSSSRSITALPASAAWPRPTGAASPWSSPTTTCPATNCRLRR